MTEEKTCNLALLSPPESPGEAEVQDALTRTATGALSPFARLSDIPEEDLWLQNQRSAHTRRAYKEDVQHFGYYCPTPNNVVLD